MANVKLSPKLQLQFFLKEFIKFHSGVLDLYWLTTNDALATAKYTIIIIFIKDQKKRRK